MTVNVANTANNNTFDYWRNRTNELAYYMSVYAVTANGSNAAVGNAAITGTFVSNSITTNTINSNLQITVGNASLNSVFINTTYISIGNSSINAQANSTYFTTKEFHAGSNVTVNTSSVFVTGLVGGVYSNALIDKQKLYITANASASVLVNATAIDIINSSSEAILTAADFVIGTSYVNSSIITTGAGGLIANTTAVKVGSNAFINTSTLIISGLTNNSIVNSSVFTIGNSAVNSVINSSSISSYNVYLGSNLVVNTSTFFVGNSTIFSTTNSTIASVGNSSVNTTINSSSISSTWGYSANQTQTVIPGTTSLVINTATIAMGTTAANVVITNSAFVSQNSSYTTTVNANGITTNGFLIVGSNTTITGNAVEIGITANGYANVKNDLFVRGNLVVNGSLTYTGNAIGDIIPNVNSVYSLGDNGRLWKEIWANTIYTSNNITVGSNVYVNNDTSIISVGTGTTNTTITANSLSVNGFLIANSSGVYGSALINATSFTVGTSTIANSIGVYSGIVNATTIQASANFTANSTLVNAAAINIVGQVNTATLYSITSANIASAVQANATGVWTTGTVNGALISVGSSFTANSTLANTVALNVNNTINVGNSTINVVANSTSIKLANSTTSITITNPTLAQASNSNNYLSATGAWVNIPVPVSNGSFTTTGTSAQNVDSYQMSVFSGAEYVIHVNDQTTLSSNARYISKLLTTHNRTTGYVTEYASMYSNTINTLGVFSVTTNVSHVILQFTPNALITNTYINFVRTSL